MIGNATKLSSLTVAAYTGFVATSDYMHYKSIKTNSFFKGTADDMIMDGLQSGDIICFSRRWYHFHIPTAIMIQFYQQFIGEYDHCGVIVHNKYGIPFVFEKTAWGAHLIPFDRCILQTRARQVILVPLTPRFNRTGVSEDQLFQSTSIRAANESPEFLSQCGGILKYLFDQTSSNSKASMIYCSKTSMVLDTLKEMGVMMNNKPTSALTIESFHRKNMSFDYSPEDQRVNSAPKILVLGGAVVLR